MASIRNTASNSPIVMSAIPTPVSNSPLSSSSSGQHEFSGSDLHTDSPQCSPLLPDVNQSKSFSSSNSTTTINNDASLPTNTYQPSQKTKMPSEIRPPTSEVGIINSPLSTLSSREDQLPSESPTLLSPVNSDTSQTSLPVLNRNISPSETLNLRTSPNYNSSSAIVQQQMRSETKCEALSPMHLAMSASTDSHSSRANYSPLQNTEFPNDNVHQKAAFQSQNKTSVQSPNAIPTPVPVSPNEGTNNSSPIEPIVSPKVTSHRQVAIYDCPAPARSPWTPSTTPQSSRAMFPLQQYEQSSPTASRSTISPSNQPDPIVKVFDRYRSPSPSETENGHKNKLDGESIAENDLPWWFPHIRGEPIFYGNKEALGWALDAIARSIGIISAAAFLTTSWLNIVKEEAGCQTKPLPGEIDIPECDGLVYGIRPSSMLTIYTTVMSIIGAVFMPLLGAVVDFTPHRRKAGRWFSFLVCVFMLPTIFVSENTWELVALAFLLMSFLDWCATVVAYAYLPELTDDEEILNYYSKMFTALPYLASVMFLLGVLGVAYIFDIMDDDVAVTQLAQLAALVISIGLFTIAWGVLLQPRPTANQLPEGKSMFAEAFLQIHRTSIKVFKEYHALKWFYVSIAFCEAGILTFGVIALTYQTDTLLLSSTQNGTSILINLIATVPGAFIGSWFTKLCNPIWSSVLATIVTMIVVFLYAGILKGPGQQMETYAVMIGWGLGAGWKWTCDKMLAALIIPEGQEAEFMGFYACAIQLLSWLPPVLFIILNEFYVSQRIGIATVNIFFFIGIMAYLKMGNYQDALNAAKRPSQSQISVLSSQEKEVATAGACCADTMTRNMAEV